MTAPISEGVHGTPELNGVSLNDFSTASNVKRTDYLSWDEYFMSLAFLSAMRSKDPITQVGVCIINSEKKIVAVGYNGMPVGLSDDEMPWTKGLDDPLQNKHLYVCHAELNAVLNKNSADVKNCTLYSTLFPCNECAKVIIQCGIKEVVYFSDAKINKPQYNAAKIMFAKAGVKTTSVYHMAPSSMSSSIQQDGTHGGYLSQLMKRQRNKVAPPKVYWASTTRF
uniref:dCMP deaminase n=1 Tax=Schistocephalus solidus TaxID=70667 RepID=A0A0X3Q9A8_SCHSO